MDLFYVDSGYCQFLRQHDEIVEDNKNGTRPYVGVVINLGEIEYYAPLTSPKEKHKTMKNMKDFRKINGGKYGAINFNNMIPVKKDYLTKIDIDNLADVKYRRLLQNQYRHLQHDEKQIRDQADKLRKLVLSATESLSEADKRIKARCCDFALLEKVYMNYTGSIIIDKLQIAE